MGNTFLLALPWLLFGHLCFSQSDPTLKIVLKPDSTAMRYAETITEADLNNYLSILASDALEGRDTGSRGQKMAAAFIREHFRDNHLKPIVVTGSDSLFFQKFDLYRNFYQDVYLEADGRKYLHMKDLLYFGNADISSPQEISLQFVGDGEKDDYRGLNTKEAMVSFFARTLDERQRRIKIARDNGAKAVFIINSDSQSEFDDFVEENGEFFQATTITKEKDVPGANMVFFGHTDLLSSLLGIDSKKLAKAYQKSSESSKNPYRKLQPSTIYLKVDRIAEEFETENVLGLVEGNSKKDELVVITAHYDHVGRNGDQIYNGADDDGSGTVALMEMAQAFALAKKNGQGPERSILFMTVTGEEKGLLGSEYYSDHPTWPLEKTIANLNIDMIGRIDPSHENNQQYLYIIGSDRLSMDLHQINERVNELYTNLTLDYKFNAADDPNRFYYRSDHYNFAKHNIPIIFYFNGTHADYHQPSDTIDKIRFDLLKKRAELIFHCAWELANREERIRLSP